jgi:hypothetical protein
MGSEGLVWKEDRKGVSIFEVNFEGEGFDLSTITPFLKKATKKGSFVVHFEDHKGEDRYAVKFGPGFCEDVKNLVYE